MDPLGLLTVSGLNGWLVIVTWNAVAEFIAVSALEAQLVYFSLATFSDHWLITILNNSGIWLKSSAWDAISELITVSFSVAYSDRVQFSTCLDI